MKLTPAKCPSCGANIDVNEKLEKTICQYCGTTVLIEEAIEKYKIELSGKVEVEGIKTNSQKIESAKKHMKPGEYLEAKRILDEVNKDDSFNVEAQCLWIKNAILLNNFKAGFFGELNYSRWDYIKEFGELELIIETYERMKKIDEREEYKTLLESELEIIDYLENEYEKNKQDEAKLLELTEKIRKDVPFNTYMTFLANELKWDKEKMKWIRYNVNLKPDKSFLYPVTFNWTEFKISRTGGLFIRYDATQYNNVWATYYFKSLENPYTTEETIEKLNHVLEIINNPQYMENFEKRRVGYAWYNYDISKVDDKKRKFLGLF